MPGAPRNDRTETGWMAAPSVPALPGPLEVHVWRAQVFGAGTPDWPAVLSKEERERADRFRLAEDRCRFANTRTLLRLLLGRYLGQAPSSLRFRYNAFGKPALDCPAAETSIGFNVAHSGDYSLLAFSSGLDVGIDLEYLQIERDISGLARAIYPPAQYRQFLTTPRAQRNKEFLRAWTRREAVGKALGIGISMDHDAYEGALADAAEWSICQIDVADDYVASLAARIQKPRIHLWDCAAERLLPEDFVSREPTSA